ncbi:MAG: hypothetical protein LBP95_11360 [Deltaproteobacteria bacterium]|jgi:hypothetical protein|nr:hypothetical protein [Deltaproteobacteria bacterium]
MLEANLGRPGEADSVGVFLAGLERYLSGEASAAEFRELAEMVGAALEYQRKVRHRPGPPAGPAGLLRRVKPAGRPPGPTTKFLTVGEREEAALELLASLRATAVKSFVAGLKDEAHAADAVALRTAEYLAGGIELGPPVPGPPRTILTMLGSVAYPRPRCRPRDSRSEKSLVELTGRKAVFPVDECLGAARLPHKMTTAAMLEVAREFARHKTTAEAREALKKARGFQIGEGLVAKAALTVGEAVFRSDKLKLEKFWGEPAGADGRGLGGGFQPASKPGPGDRVYLKITGLTPSWETPVAAKAGRPPLMLGLVFLAKPVRPEPAPAAEVAGAAGPGCVCLPSLGDVRTLFRSMYAEAHRKGCAHGAGTVVISDGGGWAGELRKRFFPDAKIILDYNDLKGRIRSYADRRFHRLEGPVAWTEQILGWILNGRVQKAVDGVGRTMRQDLKNVCQELMTFISDNKDYVDYDNYLEGDFLTTSYDFDLSLSVLQARMDFALSEQTVVEAQYVAALVAKELSGRWEDVETAVRELYGG